MNLFFFNNLLLLIVLMQTGVTNGNITTNFYLLNFSLQPFKAKVCSNFHNFKNLRQLL